MAKKSWFERHVRKINRLLLAAIILINAYIVLTPFLPQAAYQVKQVFTEPQKIDTPEARAVIPRDSDHLLIPKIDLDQKIWFGDSEWLVNKGVWHIPDSSTPDKGSNTVLVGHRFTYKDPAVFYHLDKLAIDDPIIAVVDGKLYTYKVTEKKIVNPTDVWVEDATEDTRLTLYTCDPIWSTRNRLVIVAGLESVE